MTPPGSPAHPTPGPGRGAGRDRASALAALYDLDLAEDPGDLDLHLALAARSGDPVLELGVGSGRIAVPLAAAGREVHGVDVDDAMLARARRAARAAGPGVARRLTLVRDDARTVRLPEAGRFGLALCALGSIHLVGGRADQAALVATLAAHLAPGGVAVVDAWLPDAEDLARCDGRSALEWVREEPGTGRVVTKTTSARHDAAAGVVHLVTIFEAGRPGAAPARWIREDALRLVAADELAAFATAAGLAVEALAGDLDLGPLGPASERIVLVARRP